ncbi:MAG: flagellar protein [Clostridia bacterium]|nr:flagellar protein [Clostridia bacterium]
MHDKFFIQQQPIRPISSTVTTHKEKVADNDQKSSFQAILEKQIAQNQELKFSKHAQDRLNLRNIKLSSEEVSKLNTAVEKAANKGAKESLILMDNLAFVVSIKNKTVITAIDGANIKDNVFTNIDSAIVI